MNNDVIKESISSMIGVVQCSLAELKLLESAVDKSNLEHDSLAKKYEAYEEYIELLKNEVQQYRKLNDDLIAKYNSLMKKYSELLDDKILLLNELSNLKEENENLRKYLNAHP